MKIPLSRPPMDDEIKGAALAAIESRQYILGPECKAFEAEFARYIGTRHAVLTSSGTAALWITLKALGAKAGDEVLVPAHTAFPTVEAVCFSEATPVFVDVDGTYTLDLADAAEKITSRTVGIIPVHIYGHPVNLTRVQELVSRHGLWLVEDCCQSHGAAWQGKKVGAFGRAGAFSFYPSKNLTVMGDGGILVTDDDEIAARCRRLRDHGRLNKDVHSEVGFNLRFNDIQAAIGRVILRRLDAMNERRRQLAQRYAERLEGLPLVLPTEQPGARHVFHLYPPLRHPDGSARRAGRLSPGAGDPDRHPLPGPLSPPAGCRELERPLLTAHREDRPGDPQPAALGRSHGGGDRPGRRRRQGVLPRMSRRERGPWGLGPGGQVLQSHIPQTSTKDVLECKT
ncbi:MAG: DegT/DnrJ/EryC1/StrS family aminotransferase [Candidatus Rokubacteria bacterium]|nr:DegT/DnrJ/EryC1/StrS family aminotransferase [Candidatus Rokubacteria bacterium]